MYIFNMFIFVKFLHRKYAAATKSFLEEVTKRI